MPKIDPDATYGSKLLRLFRRLVLKGGRHYQKDLADWLHCSKQTVIRLASEIESEIGTALESGIDEHKRRWYEVKTISRARLGLTCEEVRFLSICRDLAEPILPDQVKQRVDESLLNFSMLLSDAEYANRERLQGAPHYAFYNRGRIDYTQHFDAIEALTSLLDTHRICLLRYRAAGDHTCREHKFVPSRFVALNGALYVIGAITTDNFKKKRHLVSFAVHRIQEVTPIDRYATFDIEEEGDSLDRFGLPWHEPREFVVKFNPGAVSDYIRERTWGDRQQLIELPNGGVELKIMTCSGPEVMSWVRSFGKSAELIKGDDTIKVREPI